MADQKVTVRVPSVRYPGPDDTDASFYRGAASKLRRGYDAGGSNVRDAIAALLDRVADQLDPTLTEPAMDDQERAYYTAARDLQGNARLRSGRGLLVADTKHTIAEVRVWEANAERNVPGRIERAEESPWHWVRQYRAVRELLGSTNRKRRTVAEQLVSPKVEALAQELAADPELNDGRHMLVIAEGDCESISLCTCGTPLGADRPDVSADLIVERWQRHAMGLSR